jgi:hypothetical protein
MFNKIAQYFFLRGVVFLIIFSIYGHITYANELNKLAINSKNISKVYSDSTRLQSIVSNATNQNRTNGIELVGSVTHVVDGDTLDINGILNINEKLMDNKLAKILTEYCDISEFANERWASTSCKAHQ